MRINLIVAVWSCSIGALWAQTNNAQEQFWNRLQAHCGKAYTGKIHSSPVPEDFADKNLVMYVMSCSDSEIKIPFYVGNDHSRTWVLTKTPQGIQLKHDHRNRDGSEDKITQYGGITSNTGFDQIQFFPADQHTVDLIPAAAANVWWITVDDKEYSYNLRRADSTKYFEARFDLTMETVVPERPWGH